MTSAEYQPAFSLHQGRELRSYQPYFWNLQLLQQERPHCHDHTRLISFLMGVIFKSPAAWKDILEPLNKVMTFMAFYLSHVQYHDHFMAIHMYSK